MGDDAGSGWQWGYALIAMRYEERDLAWTFGTRYNGWRSAAQ